MSQISFADAEYAGKRKKTRREVFLDEIRPFHDGYYVVVDAVHWRAPTEWSRWNVN